MRVLILLLFLINYCAAQSSKGPQEYNLLAKQAAQDKNYTEAIRFFKKEKSLYPKQKANLDLAKCSYNLAVLYRTTAQYPKAITESNQTIKYYQKLYGPTHKETLDAHILHIKNLYKNFQLKDSHQEIQHALQIFRDSLAHYPKEKHTLQILDANVLIEQGQYKEAEQLLQKTLKTSSDKNTLASIYNNLGALKEYQQLDQQAFQHYLQVLKLKQEVYPKNHPELAIIYHNLGIVRFKLEDFEQAQEWFEQSYAINSKHYGLKHDQTAQDLNSLGSIYYEQNQLDKAKDYFLQAASIYTDIWKKNTTKLSIPYQKLAQIATLRGNYNQAIDYYKQTLILYQKYYKADHPDILKIYISIGEIQQAQGDYQTATAGYLQALKIIKSYSFWTLKISEQLLFCLLEQQAYKDAYKLLPNVLHQIQILNQKWKQDVDQQQFSALIASINEYGLFSCWQLYQQTQKTEYLQQALELIECNKALSLTKVWQDRQWSQQLGVDEQIIQSSHQLAIQINHWEQEWSNAIQKKDSSYRSYCNQLLLELQQELDSLQQLPELPKWQKTATLNLERFKQPLSKEHTILNYFYGQKNIYCLSLTTDSTKLTKIQIDTNFQKLFKHYLNSLQDLNLAKENISLAAQKYQKQSFDLYNKLVLPCLSSQAIQQISISPDGPLYYIPFGALTNQWIEDVKGFHQLPYCIQDYAVAYIHSLQLWDWQSQHKVSPHSSMLGLAPLDYQIQLDSVLVPLPKLPATQKELDHLQDHFAGHFAQNLPNINTALAQHSILHLATHAWADHQKPLNAYLAVGNQQILYTHQLAQLPLKADLVVLSACETGLGRIQEGEGVLSIARGFIYAGVPSIALTLWTVNDQSSYELTVQFYEALCQSQNKAQAIQMAQQNYISDHSAFRSHPFFWAAYQVWGDIQPLNISAKSNYPKSWLIYASLSIVSLGLIGRWQYKKRT
ncbi:MAG: CHAT domain-containing protein [Aureispira sp.]|nr:CHAT domain-containing protein [Aureispira sp.]